MRNLAGLLGGKGSGTLFVVSMLVVVLTLFTALDTNPVHRTQEVRVAETAAGMVQRGDYLVPYFNGSYRFQKPPLAYWMTALSYKITGVINEISVRLFGVLFSLGSLVVIYFWGRQQLSSYYGCCVAAVLVSSFIPIKLFRSGETDSLLLFFIIVAAFFAYRLVYHKQPGRWTATAFYGVMGLGMLAKGPPAFIFPMGLLIIGSIHQRQWNALKSAFSVSGITLFLLLSFSWYAYLYIDHPEEIQATLFREVNDTYVTGDHKNPVYYYLSRFFGYYAPWSLLFLPAIYWVWTNRGGLPNLISYALYWFILVFVVLSLNVNKQAHYSLLLAPPFALLVGYYLAYAEGRHRRFIHIFCGLFIAAVLIFAAFFMWKVPFRVDYGVALGVLGGSVYWLYRSGLKFAIPVIMLAGLIGVVFPIGSQTLNGPGTEPWEMKRIGLMVRNSEYEPLYFYGRIESGVVFYAREPITVLKKPVEVEELVKTSGQMFLLVRVGEEPELNTGITSEVLVAAEEKELWKLSLSPINEH